MARPPVSIQDRQRKGVTTYEVWVNRELVGEGYTSKKQAHEKAKEYGGAPGWGKAAPVEPAALILAELDELRAEVKALRGGR